MVKKLQNYWPWLVLGILIVIYTVVFSYFSIRRHDAFYSGYDLANMDQTVWNSLHGRLFTLTTNDGASVSRFSIHADLILVLLAPLYLIWDNVRMLLIAQSFFLALASIPIYLIALKILKNRLLGILIVIMYLLNPTVQWANIFSFHAVTIAIPLLFLSFYLVLIKKWSWLYLTVFLALLTKEEVGLTTAVLGLIVAFYFKERKHGLLIFILSLVWSFLMVKVVIPKFTLSHFYYFFSWYNDLVKTTKMYQLYKVPFKILQRFFLAPDAQYYLFFFMKIYAFLPLIGLPWLVLTLPELLINLLSGHAQMRAFNFHYQSVIIPGMTISMIFGISYIKLLLLKIRLIKPYVVLLTLLIVFIAFIIRLRINYHYGPLPSTPSHWQDMYKVTREEIEFEKILQTIPINAKTTASPEIKPHLTHRAISYTFPYAAETADYVAIIDQNRMVGDNNPKTVELEIIKKLNINPNYELISHVNHFYLYKRKIL